MLVCPIEDYKFKSSTPTEELMVMCRMLLDVGSYASTILDKAHQVFSRKCLAINKKVENELINRKAVNSLAEVYDAPGDIVDSSDLSKLTISQLDTLYRQSRIRFEERLADRRETLTRHFETRIVREMKSRKAVTPTEQLKIDYCDRTNRDELNNLSALLDLPLGEPDADLGRHLTPHEMTSLIETHRRYKSVAERETLIATVDKAIDYIDRHRDHTPSLNLAATLVDLHHYGRISSPAWIERYLLDSVNERMKHPFTLDRAMILPYLTAYYIKKDRRLRWRAIRIINACYRTVTSPLSHPAAPDFLENLHTAEAYSDYVTNYSPRKIAAARGSISSAHLERFSTQ